MTEVLDPQQEAMMKAAEPKAQHAWLQKLVGELAYETECSMGPGQPVESFTGTEQVRALGDLWVVGDSQGEMPGGGQAQMRLTLGYDNQKGCFVGSWIGTMTSYQWVYEGQLDASERVLTLDCEGPSFSGDGTMSRYQDVIAVQGDEERTLTARFQNPDGTWAEMMTTRYRRVR